MPKRVREKFEFLETQISNVRGWLSTFGTGAPKARPQHDVEIQQTKLDMLKEIRDDYKQSLEKYGAGS